MALELYTAPSVEPLTLQEVKDHLRIVDATPGIEDPDLERMIATAREVLDGRDGELGRQLINATWDLVLDEFPVTTWISLPLSPVQSITSITYTDANGSPQTFDASNYSLSADRNVDPKVHLGYGLSWPSTRNVPDAVTVRYVAGYGATAADIPSPLRSAMLLLVGHLYSQREATVPGVSIAELPMGVEALITAYKRFRFI